MLKLRRERGFPVLFCTQYSTIVYSADTNRWPLPVGGRMICLF